MFIPYTALLWTHLGTLAVTLVLVYVADKKAISWMMGRKETLQREKVLLLHNLIWIGLGLMILSGFLMFYPSRDFFLSHGPFQAKMFFVLVLVINSFFIGKISKIASEKPFKELPIDERLPLFISGMVSFVAWVGAIVSALLMNI